MPDTELLSLLTADIETCKRLVELLDQEYSALGERKLEQLEQLLAEKQPLLQMLAQNANKRSQLLNARGLSADAQGFQALASQLPGQEQLLSCHEQLQQLMEACQTANLRNGRLIRINQVSVGSALNILRGNDGPSLYDSSGSTAYKGTQRTFTRA